MNTKQVQAILNPNPDGTSLGSRLRPCRADGVFRSVGDIDGCAAEQDHAVGNLIEDHIMTALGNVPCNGCRACCLHDMIPLMPERGDLIWTLSTRLSEPGRYIYRFGYVTVTAEDLEVWKQFPHAEFALVARSS